MGLVSNALPLQFWTMSSQTYNESIKALSNGFVLPYPFIHEWKDSDPIKLQVAYETDPEAYYGLKAIDRDGNLIEFLPFIKTVLTSFNEFDLSFSGDNFNGVDLTTYGLVQFVITANNGTLDDLTMDDLTLDTFGDGTDLWKTDYVRFSTSIPVNEFVGSKVLSYRSLKNFASINYPNDGNYFSIRLPAKFFTQRTTTQQSTIPLSNSIINTSEMIKFQTHLEFPVLPDYMLNKIELILSHAVRGSLLIDGAEWTKEEGFNRSPVSGDIRFPMQSGEVWLTQKENLIRNVI
jgi:hypothetical protein